MSRTFNSRNRYSRGSISVLAALFLILASNAIRPLVAQMTGSVVESGKFRLHKFQQPIGEETYSVTKDGGSLQLNDDFKFVDRGSPVPLTTSLKTDSELNPQSYTIKGRV